jgi:hypothetical protein
VLHALHGDSLAPTVRAPRVAFPHVIRANLHRIGRESR